jgi:hypothetical protein
MEFSLVLFMMETEFYECYTSQCPVHLGKELLD